MLWTLTPSLGLGIGSKYPERVRIRLPHKEERACHFSPGKVCFYETAFQCGFRFPVHPFIMELLNHFNIAPGKLIPNSWRIVISCMEQEFKSSIEAMQICPRNK